MKSGEKKEWCIALDNVSSYIDSVLGLRYKFLKGERATKEKVFSMIPSITEEEYARYFRPATEEEINGEFEWDGEQYVLEKTKRMKSIKEKAEEYAFIKEGIDPSGIQYCDFSINKKDGFEAGANYVLECFESILPFVAKKGIIYGKIKETIEQLKK